MKVTKIPRKRDQHRRRVAAYCRVSTMLDNQEDSYAAQVAYYTGVIEMNPEWEFAGIYSDEKSGTKAENRPGFQQMIKDALDGKVDYILTKSISRFSRNLVDAQHYADLLKGNGVFIKFEKENLDTSEPSSSMMFSFLAVIAQNESKSISDNVRWGYRERFRRGEYNLGSNRVFGYDCVDGKLVPNEDAAAVRLIFQMFMDGKSNNEIAEEMNKAGVTGRIGKPLSPGGIRYILSNEVYVGDKLLQKQAPVDVLTKRPEKNVEYESNYLTDDHEAIIGREEWDKVKEMLDGRRKDIDAGVKRHGANTHFLFGKVFCAECGSPMTRRTFTAHSGEKYKAWICRERRKGKAGNGCKCRTVKEDELLEAIAMEMGYDGEFPEEQFLDEVERVEVRKYRVDVRRKEELTA